MTGPWNTVLPTPPKTEAEIEAEREAMEQWYEQYPDECLVCGETLDPITLDTPPVCSDECLVERFDGLAFDNGEVVDTQTDRSVVSVS